MLSILSVTIFFEYYVTDMIFKLQKIFKDFEEEGIPVLSMSTVTEDGVMDVKSQVKIIKTARNYNFGIISILQQQSKCRLLQ